MNNNIKKTYNSQNKKHLKIRLKLICIFSEIREKSPIPNISITRLLTANYNIQHLSSPDILLILLMKQIAETLEKYKNRILNTYGKKSCN
ncbi:hypothetical protein GF385_01375 [Candidatus Dependentiae bacterium]|nr:hypothetical protein [Candidatus Dependentiae bacterium]